MVPSLLSASGLLAGVTEAPAHELRGWAADRALAAAKIPWYLWCGALAVTSMEIGKIWDYSWHRSIGRDTFWTPAHMAIQSGGLLAAAVCCYLILTATFSGSHQAQAPSRAASVRIFGLRAPLGAFITAWGGLTMATSVPFDNWWHEAYGLDVRIVSPPHMVLIFGGQCVLFGMLLLILSNLHRATEVDSPATPALERLYLYVGGVQVISQMFLIIQILNIFTLHTSQPYRAIAAVVPVLFALLAQAYPAKWPATVAAATYTLVYIASILILPLFPAQPKLGPVFHPVTHMVPSTFPMLILVPAILLDLLNRRMRNQNPWLVAGVTGVVFVVSLVAVEWPFADFLLTRWAANRFFGTIYFDFGARANDLTLRLAPPGPPLHLAKGMLEACMIAATGALLGVTLGRWMRNVRR